MTDEKIKIYTEKIAKANRTELIVLLYDMFLDYISDARDCFKKDDMFEFTLNIKRAEKVLMHLEDSLDFTYPISNNLYSLYVYCQRVITQTIYKKDIFYLPEAEKVITSLRGSFEEIAKTDKTESIMKNTENIVYGMTYGKNDINKMTDSSDDTRGYFA